MYVCMYVCMHLGVLYNTYTHGVSWKLPGRFRMVLSCGIIQRFLIISVLGFLMVSVVAGNVSLWFPSLVSLWFPWANKVSWYLRTILAEETKGVLWHSES